jgi:hypothetical protein
MGGRAVIMMKPLWLRQGSGLIFFHLGRELFDTPRKHSCTIYGVSVYFQQCTYRMDNHCWNNLSHLRQYRYRLQCFVLYDWFHTLFWNIWEIPRLRSSRINKDVAGMKFSFSDSHALRHEFFKFSYAAWIWVVLRQDDIGFGTD